LLLLGEVKGGWLAGVVTEEVKRPSRGLAKICARDMVGKEEGKRLNLGPTRIILWITPKIHIR